MSQSPRSFSKDLDDLGMEEFGLKPGEGFALANMVGGESENNSDASKSSTSSTVDGGEAGMQLEERPESKLKLKVKRVFGVQSKKSQCCLKWQDTHPEQDVEAQAADAERENRETYSILHKQMMHGGDTTWKTHSIDINNPIICAFISKCLEGYPGERFSKSKITLKPPYMSLFHSFHQIQEALEKQSNVELTSGCRLLFDILLEDWKPFAKDFKEFQSSGLMTYQSVWTIFPPGELVVLTINNEISIGRVCKTRISGAEVKAIDYTDSSTCGYTIFERSIDYFQGLQKVSDLNVYPLQYTNDPITLEKKLIARGRKFESLKGRHVKYYKGGKHGFSGRVVIDASAYFKFHRTSIDTSASFKFHQAKTHHYWETEDRYHDPDYAFSEGNASENEEESEDCEWPLTDRQLLLTVPYVRGFDLRTKKWELFNIDRLEDVVWNDKAFEQLVLNSDQKKLVWALVKQKSESRDDTQFDDFISGKGKGVIILLCGPPGVGKTLTAESVAEKLKMPLYILGADDLGAEVTKAESVLQQSMDICAFWKCVLLIDEADVFMGERHIDSLKRNELVSVFLRLIEYYTGIMFLTTNRMGVLDSAFGSRIDMIVPFLNLDQLARRKVWKTFIETLPRSLHCLDDSDYESLSQWHFNGREIKSAIKTSLILAKSEDEKLHLSHLETVLKTRKKASEYQQLQRDEVKRV